MFKKNLLIYFSGESIKKVFSLYLLYLIIANLTIEEFGLYAFKDVFKLVLTFMFTLGILDLAIPRFFMDSDYDKKEIFSHALPIFVFYIILFCMIIFIFKTMKLSYVNSIFFIPIGIVAISFIFEKFNDMCLRIYVFENKSKDHVMINNLIIIGTIVFFVILMNFFTPLTSLVLSELIVSFIFTVFFMLMFKEYIGFKVSKFKELILYAYPLLFNKFFKLINNSTDKIVIQFLIDLEAVGIYAFIQRISLMFYSISQVFITSWSSTSLNYFLGKSNENLKSISKLLLLLLLLLSLLFSIFSFQIASIFDKNDIYVDYYQYIPLYFTVILLNISYQFFGVFAVYNKDTKYILKIGLVSSLINIVLSVLLCYLFGFVGVIVATIIGTFIYTYFVDKKSLSLIKVNLNKYLYLYYFIVLLNLGVYFVLR